MYYGEIKGRAQCVRSGHYRRGEGHHGKAKNKDVKRETQFQIKSEEDGLRQSEPARETDDAVDNEDAVEERSKSGGDRLHTGGLPDRLEADLEPPLRGSSLLIPLIPQRKKLMMLLIMRMQWKS